MAKHKGRLELTWTNKDKSLLSTGDGKYDYMFVEPSDRRVSEVRLLHEVEQVEADSPPDRPDELPSPTTGNLLITGDAMHVLDALTKIPEYSDKYLGKVKLVYIDPPFNTGQAFENYEDNIEHSIWLTMLRDRLRQIKSLLSKNASVWVHLDDVEVHRCRSVMDEELGAENFIGTIVWEKVERPRMDSKGFSYRHDTILVYSKSPRWTPNAIVTSDIPDYYNLRDEEGRLYTRAQLRKGGSSSGREDRPNMYFGIVAPDGSEVFPKRDDGRDGRWRWSKASVSERYGELEWVAGRRGWNPYTRIYADNMALRPPETIWLYGEVGSNTIAKKEIKALLPGQDAFDTPKPERLLQRIIHIATNPGDIVLDCFAGSGTTAAVAHKMGRRWVTSELLPKTADTFTKPRLAKVVRGEDRGGITTTTERVPAQDTELPDGLTPNKAQEFQTTLGKVVDTDSPIEIDLSTELAKAVRREIKSDEPTLTAEESKALLALLKKSGSNLLDVTNQVSSELRKRTKTKDETTINWHGGGGFTHLEVGPSMFVEVGGMVLLADWATRGNLTKAMCAQLGVRHNQDGIFAGKKGRIRYVVIDGLVLEDTILTILDQLPESEIVEVWATQIDESAIRTLRKTRPGSRLEAIPASVLDAYRRKAAKQSPFGKAAHAPTGAKR